MNERIKKLAEQAGAEIKTLTDGSEYRSLYQPDGTGFDLEKFAELIVKECADYMEYQLQLGGHKAAILKQHFGVEE